MCFLFFFFFFKQKTAYEIVSGDWSSDVCSSDLTISAASRAQRQQRSGYRAARRGELHRLAGGAGVALSSRGPLPDLRRIPPPGPRPPRNPNQHRGGGGAHHPGGDLTLPPPSALPLEFAARRHAARGLLPPRCTGVIFAARCSCLRVFTAIEVSTCRTPGRARIRLLTIAAISSSAPNSPIARMSNRPSVRMTQPISGMAAIF